MYKVDIYEDGGPRSAIFDYLSNDNLLKSGTLEKAVDAIDEFRFDMIHHNLYIGSLKTLIEVQNLKTNEIVFRGRILLPSNQMGEDGLYDSDYTAEGAMAYLHDSYPSYATYTNYTPRQYLSALLSKHNAAVEPYKQLKLGNVTFTKKVEVSTDPSYDTTRYAYTTPEKSTMDHIRDDGVNRWGGEIYARYEADGTYIDWLDETTVVKTTPFKIGRNIKSIKKTIDPLDVITRLIPLGSAETNQYNQQARITIDSVNGGKSYIDIPELIKLYGIQTGTEVFDDKDSPELVLQAGQAKVAEIKKQVAKVQIDVNVLDLSTIDLEPDQIQRGNKHRCYVDELGINGEVLRIVATTEDIMNPQNKSIRIGERPLTSAEVQAQQAAEKSRLMERRLTSTTNDIKKEVNYHQEVITGKVRGVLTVTDANGYQPIKNGVTQFNLAVWRYHPQFKVAGVNQPEDSVFFDTQNTEPSVFDAYQIVPQQSYLKIILSCYMDTPGATGMVEVINFRGAETKFYQSATITSVGSGNQQQVTLTVDLQQITSERLDFYLRFNSATPGATIYTREMFVGTTNTNL
ncbi:hypothetical protein ERX35_007815 [Macrococcus equipercicus]|uniref:Tail spike domain-containing protein n=1 Tax=Macrococcus equipercicus TaxID=69967 RepID=A0ABQ6R7P6_9STAP|nr:phage tail spike protein [Macrococcus equipercicus]KAA1039113.1 hypothetical protein ERX35_007815 [Macrococcus equipercicus]